MAASLPHTKTVKAKGKTYVYFDTGQSDAAGRKVYKRLPDPKDRAFGVTYAAYLAHRNRRIEPESTLLIPALIALYEKAPQFKKLAHATQDLYGYYLRRLADRFYNTPADEIARHDLVRLMDEMAETPIAANMTLKVANALYTWGRRRGHVKIDPFREIEQFEGGEYEPWPLDLLDAALASENPRVRLMVGLLYFTAQRIGDVLKMRWSDIRADGIHVRQQKTKKQLVIPIHSGLRPIIDAAERNGLMIVTRQDGGPLGTERARAILQGFATGLGHKVVPHGLRKNAVNALLECGCSVAETAAISGQSLQMIEHYAKRRNSVSLGSAAILRWEGKR
jgi:integrase